MNTLQFSNIFNIRKGRFSENGSRFESVAIESVSFNSSLDSFSSDELYFTNFVNTPEQKPYKIIDDLYKNIMSNNIRKLNDYVFDELYPKERVMDRLINIINISSGNDYDKSDICNIYKLKNINEPKIHLYVEFENNHMNVLLIDLFHLDIPADIYQNNRHIKTILLADFPKMYEKVKNNRYSLNHIIDL